MATKSLDDQISEPIMTDITLNNGIIRISSTFKPEHYHLGITCIALDHDAGAQKAFLAFFSTAFYFFCNELPKEWKVVNSIPDQAGMEYIFGECFMNAFNHSIEKYCLENEQTEPELKAKPSLNDKRAYLKTKYPDKKFGANILVEVNVYNYAENKPELVIRIFNSANLSSKTVLEIQEHAQMSLDQLYAERIESQTGNIHTGTAHLALPQVKSMVEDSGGHYFFDYWKPAFQNEDGVVVEDFIFPLKPKKNP